MKQVVKEYPVTVAGLVMLIVTIIAFSLLATFDTKAQDTAPAWEYAALAYDGDTAFAFTADLAANNEINKIYDAMDADTMTSIGVMNVLGERGWEYVDYQPGSTTVYFFKRPKG